MEEAGAIHDQGWQAGVRTRTTPLRCYSTGDGAGLWRLSEKHSDGSGISAGDAAIGTYDNRYRCFP